MFLVLEKRKRKNCWYLIILSIVIIYFFFLVKLDVYVFKYVLIKIFDFYIIIFFLENIIMLVV